MYNIYIYIYIYADYIVCVRVCDTTINVSYIGLEDWYWQLDVNVMQKLVLQMIAFLPDSAT